MGDEKQKKSRRYSEDLRIQQKSSLKRDNCFCLLLLILFLASLFGYTCFKASHSELKKLTLPFDPDLRACGFGDLQEYPFIYFVRPDINYIYQQNVCVKSCPKTNSSTETIECKTNTFVKDCKFDDQSKIYATREEFGKICMPIDEDLYNKISQALQISSIEQAILTVEKENSSIVLFTSISIICTLILLGFSFFEWKPFKLYGSPAVTTLGMLGITAFSVLFFYISLSEDTSDEPWSQEAKQDPESFYRKRLIRENGDYTLHLLIGIFFGILTLYNFVEMSSIYKLTKNQQQELRYDCYEASRIVGKRGIILLVLLVFPFVIGTLFGILEIEKNIFAIPMNDEAKQLFLYPFNKYFQAFQGIILNVICIIPAFSWILTFFCTFVEYVTAIQTFRYIEIKEYRRGKKFSDEIRSYLEVSSKRSVVKQLFQDIKDVFFTQLGSIIYYSFFQCFSLIASFHNDLVEPFYQQFNQPRYIEEVQQSQQKLNSNPTSENESEKDKNTEQMLPPTPTLEDTKLYLAVFVNHFQKIYGQQDLYQLEKEISCHPCYKKLSYTAFFESILRATLSLIPAFLYYFSKMNDDESTQSVGKDSSDLDKKQAPLLLVWGASYIIASIGTTVYRASFQYLISYEILIEGLLKKEVITTKIKVADSLKLQQKESQECQIKIDKRQKQHSDISSSNTIFTRASQNSDKRLIQGIDLQPIPGIQIQQVQNTLREIPNDDQNDNLLENKQQSNDDQKETVDAQVELERPNDLKKLREQEKIKHAQTIQKKLNQKKNLIEFQEKCKKNNFSFPTGFETIPKDIIPIILEERNQIAKLNGTNDNQALDKHAYKSLMISSFESTQKSPEEIEKMNEKSNETKQKLAQKIVNSPNSQLNPLDVAQLAFYHHHQQKGYNVLLNSSIDQSLQNDPKYQYQKKHILQNSSEQGYFNFSAFLDPQNTVNDEISISLLLKQSLSSLLQIEEADLTIIDFKFELETKEVYARYTVKESLIAGVEAKCKEIGNGIDLEHFAQTKVTLNSLLTHFQISPDIFDRSGKEGGVKKFPQTPNDPKKEKFYRGSLPHCYPHVKRWEKQEYKKPYEWTGLNLNIKSFGDEPKGWFGQGFEDSTFIVLYHGTSGKYLPSILPTQELKAGMINGYAGELCRLTGERIYQSQNEKEASNLYLSDDIGKTIQYTDLEGFTVGDKTFQFVFQCRVNPKHVRSPVEEESYYTVESQYTQNSVRPYRLLFREKENTV